MFLDKGLDKKDVFPPEGSNGWSAKSSISQEGKVTTMTHTITFKMKDGKTKKEVIVDTYKE